VFDLGVLGSGVPDDAYKAVTGDDKIVAREIKKHNQADAKALFRYSVQDSIARIAGAFAAISDLPETTPSEVRAKEAAYAGLRRGDDWNRAKWACDVWTAAFFSTLTKENVAGVPTTRHVWEAANGHPPQGKMAGAVTELARRQLFFHWPIEFPEVFASNGFDVMLGNPPWERIKLQEKEFFAARDREIAKAPNKVVRQKLINALLPKMQLRKSRRSAVNGCWQSMQPSARAYSFAKAVDTLLRHLATSIRMQCLQKHSYVEFTHAVVLDLLSRRASRLKTQRKFISTVLYQRKDWCAFSISKIAKVSSPASIAE
jgi:hypothetical protein